MIIPRAGMHDFHRRFFATDSGVTFLLRDEFPTADAAPITSPRTCEPGPGTLTVVDTGDYSSTSGGRFVYSDPGGANGLKINAGQYTRSAGLVAIFKQESDTVVGFHPMWGWFTDNSPDLGGADSETSLFYSGPGVAIVVNASSSFLVNIAHTANVDLTTAQILRSAGSFTLYKSGSDWVLAWVDNASSNATPYVGWHARDKGGSIDTISVDQLPAPWSTDYGIATQRLAGVRSAGDLLTHEADCLIEFEADALPTNAGELIDFRFRIQDATNYWQVTINDAGDIELNEIVAGASTTRGSDAANVSAGDRVVIIADDEDISVYVDNALAFATYTSASNFKTETSAKVETLDTGADMKDLISYPRTLSGAPARVLEDYTA